MEEIRARRIRLAAVAAVFVCAAIGYFWQLGALPLADYDEATYAQVTLDTQASGDITTLRKFGQPWFEKPPVYFWLAMGAVRVFGSADFVFRIPSVLAAIASCLLLWYIVKRLTKDTRAATIAAFVLLLWPFYYFAARQVRLDVPLVASMLAALAALITGWEKPRWLSAIGPALAVGFLFKSFAIVTVAPIFIMFSLCYRKWNWLTNRFTWLGILGGAAIAVPWHWYQYSRWGTTFVDSYFGFHVVARYTAGIGQNAGFQIGRYVQGIFSHAEPWALVFIAVLVYYLVQTVRRKFAFDQLTLAASGTALIIFLFYGFAKTSILTYLLPAFPFAAMTIGLFVSRLLAKRTALITYALAVVGIALSGYAIVLASGVNSKTLDTMYYPWSGMQKAVGLAVREGPRDARFYYFEWPTLEALRYYSGKELISISFPPAADGKLSGPAFLFLTNKHLGLFLNADGSVKEKYQSLEVRYRDQEGKFFLFFSPSDLVF